MTTLSFTHLELAQLATALQAELKQLEQDDPEAFSDPSSYAAQIKTLHRRIHSTVPAPVLPDGLELRKLQAEALGELINSTNSNMEFFNEEDIPQVEKELDALSLLHRELQQQICEWT